jgi:hypothetical protein
MDGELQAAVNHAVQFSAETSFLPRLKRVEYIT